MSGRNRANPGEPRYPLGELAAAVGVTVARLGRDLGLSGKTMQEYRQRGVSAVVADRLAVRCGLDPYVVWPELLDHSIAAAEKRCKECGAPFVPRSHRDKYCCPAHQRRHTAREWARRYRSTPEGAAANREARRRYYQENADYERARERRAHQARKLGASL